MKADKTGVCRFEKMKETVTVGDIFELHCEWPLSVILSKPVRIELNQSEESEGVQSPKSPYSLFVLDTVRILPGRGVFKVTGYKPGNYNTGLSLVSDKGVVKVPPVSWQVNSVIPEEKKESIKPYPPYGPWPDPLPLWYWSLGLLTILGFIVFLSVKTYFFVSRKKKIKEVKRRLKNKKPFREFISQLNLLIRETGNKKAAATIKKVDKNFRLFLENEFFISALEEKPQKIIRQLKKYYPGLGRARDVFDFFTEVNKLSSEKVKSEDSEQILDMAREAAIACLEKKERK